MTLAVAWDVKQQNKQTFTVITVQLLSIFQEVDLEEHGKEDLKRIHVSLAGMTMVAIEKSSETEGVTVRDQEVAREYLDEGVVKGDPRDEEVEAGIENEKVIEQLTHGNRGIENKKVIDQLSHGNRGIENKKVIDQLSHGNLWIENEKVIDQLSHGNLGIENQKVIEQLAHGNLQKPTIRVRLLLNEGQVTRVFT